MHRKPILYWMRRDLRLEDNPALHAAVQEGRPVVPVFIWAPDEERPWAPGAASRWWLHHSLVSLARELEKAGSRLIIRVGPSEESLHALIRETQAEQVFWSRLHEPAIIRRDSRIKSGLNAIGINAQSFNSALLHEPWTLQNKSNKPFQVFTPYWKHLLSLPEPADLLRAPKQVRGPARWPKSLKVEDLHLLPTIAWDAGLQAAWTPGEAGARDALDLFTDDAMGDYDQGRDLPGQAGTSRLSPHLHFGEIGPRQIWHAAQQAAAESRRAGIVRGSETFLREIGWREFAHHLLFHFPHTSDSALRTEFNEFPWRKDPAGFTAWTRGHTGYPIVDAGMRELWHTGWMHNRARMIVASFLVKDLLISWKDGARWFWDTLVDANLANNTLGWQWSAGSGADAAPYFRVFNPLLQGKKFDPEGVYVRRWIPELKGRNLKEIHEPWGAPIVDHRFARDRALEALSTIRKNA